jgi:hypothetical protein
MANKNCTSKNLYSSALAVSKGLRDQQVLKVLRARRVHKVSKASKETPVPKGNKEIREKLVR